MTNLDSLFNQAIENHQAGRLQEALQSYQELLQVQPDHAGALGNLGMLLCQAGHAEYGLPLFERLVELRPDNFEYHMYLGNALYMLERHDAAEDSYRKSLALHPDNAVILFNLGNAMKGQGKLEEAVIAYRQAVECMPAYRDAYVNMGHALHRLGRSHDAIDCFRQALNIDPDDPGMHHNLGLVLRSIGELEAAKESFHRALELKPDDLEILDSLLFLYNLIPGLTPDEMLREAKRYGEIAHSRARPFQNWQVSMATDKRLRIGLVSGDLSGHPVGFFLKNVLLNLDQNRIELIAYVTSEFEDDLTAQIKPLFSGWVSTVGVSDEELAHRIHEDRIDILLDLAGHTRENRLPVFAWKPAPVQIAWLGYLATTGVPGMDYLLADKLALPEVEEQQFTETIWRLPGNYLCYSPPEINVDPSRLPALDNAYVTFGCFNNAAKMNDAVVALWSRVLHAVPDSRLYLKTEELRDPELVRGVRERYAAHGIEPERLMLEGRSPDREAHFRAYQRMDIALDPFPYPGITSTMDALWMGVPVLSLKGDRFINHQGETILENVGLGEWVAADAQDFLDKAAAFASDIEALSELRGRMREQVTCSRLCDAVQFARNIENVLVEIWKRRCANLKD